jgi:hypothetical protein
MADIEKFVYYSNGSKKVLKPTDRILIGSGGLAFEGDTADEFELQLTVTDPTDDRTINFPDEDGDVALLQGDSLPKALSFPVKNPSTTTALTKGQIVYISGHSGNKPEVSLARSDSSATMPAFGFVQNDISAEAEGYVVYSGLFKGIDTNAEYSEGDTLYVSSSTAGEFQNTPPVGSNLIQNIGKIVKTDSSNGEILVGGAGRTNATPNLNEGKFFIGNASNQSVQSSYQLPSTLTNNAILVANSDGSSVLSTDLLTIDTSNDRVGIGTSSPARTLHLVGDVQYEGSMRIDQYHTSTDGPDVLMQKARGTPSTPAASQDGDELGKFVFYGHNGTNFQESASFVVTDNGSQGAEIQLKTTASGGTSPSERFEINSSGVITFNNSYSFPTSDGTSGQTLVTNGSGLLTFSDVVSSAGGSNTQLQYNNSGSFAGSANLTWDNSGGADSNGLLTSQNLTVSNRLSLGGSGSQFFAYNEDTVKVKFANWYSSNTRQYGQGQLWYEQWFGAIDDTSGAANRRIGFYLETPDKGSSDASGGTGAHPENARMWIDVNSVGFHYDNPLRIYEDGTGEKHGSNYIQIQGQSSLSSNRTLTLPDLTGTILVGDGYNMPSSLTNNAILTANSDGTSVISTSLLTIDSSNNYIGINQTSPEVTLHMTGESSQSAQIRMEQHDNSGDAPDIRTRKSRGTASSPSALTAGDYVFRLNAEYYNGTNYATMGQIAIDTSSSNAARGVISISTTKDGASVDASTASKVDLRIDGNNSGAITFNNSYTFPTSDGTSGQVLTTNGSGALSFADASGGISNLVEDTTPQLGGTLDLNSQSIQGNLTPSSSNTYSLGSTSAEWSDLYLGDSGYIYFGDDQDVRLQHIADSGLTLSMGSSQSSYDPTFTIKSSTSNTQGIGPQIKLQKLYTDANDVVGDIYFQGYLTGSYDTYGRIKVRAPAQTHGNLQLTVLSGNVETVGLDIIGDSASSTVETVAAGPIATKVTSSDPSVRGNHAHIYSKDVSGSAEMFVQDEAGNVTQISPHNEEGDWIYWSENSKTGKKVKINMEKMIKRLEQITGESFFEEYVEGN